jgi:hypothetical protein
MMPFLQRLLGENLFEKMMIAIQKMPNRIDRFIPIHISIETHAAIKERCVGMKECCDYW